MIQGVRGICAFVQLQDAVMSVTWTGMSEIFVTLKVNFASASPGSARYSFVNASKVRFVSATAGATGWWGIVLGVAKFVAGVCADAAMAAKHAANARARRRREGERRENLLMCETLTDQRISGEKFHLEWSGSRTLQLLQLRTFRGIFDDPAFSFQLLADCVGAFEVLRFFGCGPGVHQRDDFRRSFGFGGDPDAEIGSA